MKKVFVSLLLLLCTLAAPHAVANVSEESTLSIKAAQHAVAGEYNDAVSLYSKLISLNPEKTDYYIQRGLVYRQLKQTSKAVGDGATALKFAEHYMQKGGSKKQQAKRYWQRAMAHRLLEKYDLALQDIHKAMRLRGDRKWLADAQAIELESKIHSAAR